MSEVAIRFGVGDGTSRRAATWKCWAHRGGGKNDVYLTCRDLPGSLKASLHASGNWHIGFDQRFLDANAVREEWPTRFTEKWTRPSDSSPGFTLACRIVTPSVTVNVTIDPSDCVGVVWIPPPRDGHAVETVVAITAAQTPINGWPGTTMGATLVGTFALDNGDTVWVVTHEITLAGAEGAFPANARFFHGKTNADVKGPGLRMIALGKEPDGSRVLFELVEAQEAYRDPNA